MSALTNCEAACFGPLMDASFPRWAIPRRETAPVAPPSRRQISPKEPCHLSIKVTGIDHSHLAVDKVGNYRIKSTFQMCECEVTRKMCQAAFTIRRSQVGVQEQCSERDHQ